MRDHYLELLDQIVVDTLKGNIRSKEQIYHTLEAKIASGTGELFERCLQTRIDEIQALLDDDDELKQAKAIRKQRALKTIQGEWERWQKQNQGNTILTNLVQALTTAPAEQRLQPLLKVFDPNQKEILTVEQLHQLQKLLEKVSHPPNDLEPSVSTALLEIARGLQQGLSSWQQIESQVVNWIYNQSQSNLGFGNGTEQQGPWSHWAKTVNSQSLQQVFMDLAQHQAITEAGIEQPVQISDWLELALVLQKLQSNLVRWFDQQPYDAKAGKRLSIATYLTFTIVWGQLSQRFQQLGQPILTEACFQMALQGLVQFAQQSYFPLYGGLFTALSGESLQTLLDYLDSPLKQTPNTGIKARILILLGYTQQALGHYDLALKFHDQALEIARIAQDLRCEVASYNHLSRTYLTQQDFSEAITCSQRALILARQSGDRLGEANALANFGYSEILQIQAEDPLDSQRYEQVLPYLEQGVQLSEQLGDRPSQALCTNSLGTVLVIMGKYQAAIPSLEQGTRIAEVIGDQWLVSLNYCYLAEAYRELGNIEKAIYTGSLAMYLMFQIESSTWRQPAGLLSILYGQIGPETFQEYLNQLRKKLLMVIGVDGYEYLPKLLAEYRQSLA